MKQLLSISLAFLLLAGNLGLGLGIHYCGGIAVEQSLLLGPGQLGCGMEANNAACENTGDTAVSKASCCQDSFQLFQLADSFRLPTTIIHLPTIVAWIPGLSSFQTAIFTPQNDLCFSAYSPPQLSLNRPVLLQVFRL